MSDDLKQNGDLIQNWPMIKSHFRHTLQSSQFYTFATVNPDGSPHMAPYASLVLNDDCTGYYSDAFPNQMSRNLKADPVSVSLRCAWASGSGSKLFSGAASAAGREYASTEPWGPLEKALLRRLTAGEAA